MLESGFNADDGTLGYGGRLFGRPSWVGLDGKFGTARFGRQTSSIYEALLAIDPFLINGAGNAQRVYGYGLGRVDPISRADNSVTYSLRFFNGFTASVGQKFGETPGSINNNGSRFASLSYVAGHWNVQGAYQDSNNVDLGTANTQTGSIVMPAKLSSAVATVKNAFIGATYDFGSLKAHAALGDTKISNGGEVTIRNYLLGLTAEVGTGAIYGSWNRNDVRNFADGISDQYAVGYSYPLSKRTNLYTSASYTKNGSEVRLNAAMNGKSAREIQAGIRHIF